MTRPAHVVVMGVSGCGKSSVALALAETLGRPFIEGDAHHPAQNIAAMRAGIPLTDADRLPWLATLARLLKDASGPAVLACSALRRSYRDALLQGGPSVFVHLAGSREEIASRMELRKGHFMPETLLDSQFAALDPPASDEDHVTIDIAQPPDKVVAAAIKALRGRPDFKRV